MGSKMASNIQQNPTSSQKLAYFSAGDHFFSARFPEAMGGTPPPWRVLGPAWASFWNPFGGFWIPLCRFSRGITLGNHCLRDFDRVKLCQL